MYNKIKQNINNLSDDELLNLLLIISKTSADRDLIKLKEVIVSALKNGILEAETYKSLGYENMALAYGLAFMEVQNEITEMSQEDKTFTEALEDEIEGAVILLMDDDPDNKVYH